VGLLSPLGAGMYRMHPALAAFLAARWHDPGSPQLRRGARSRHPCAAQRLRAARQGAEPANPYWRHRPGVRTSRDPSPHDRAPARQRLGHSGVERRGSTAATA
jgi:hypothetical protein